MSTDSGKMGRDALEQCKKTTDIMKQTLESIQAITHRNQLATQQRAREQTIRRIENNTRMTKLEDWRQKRNEFEKFKDAGKEYVGDTGCVFADPLKPCPEGDGYVTEKFGDKNCRPTGCARSHCYICRRDKLQQEYQAAKPPEPQEELPDIQLEPVPNFNSNFQCCANIINLAANSTATENVQKCQQGIETQLSLLNQLTNRTSTPTPTPTQTPTTILRQPVILSFLVGISVLLLSTSSVIIL